MTHKADIDRLMSDSGCSPKDIENATTVLFCIVAGGLIVMGACVGYYLGGILA